MTQKQAIKELRKYDHCFLSPEGVKAFSQPFGFTPSLITVTDNRSEFKGLTLYNSKEGDKAKGLPAHTLAKAICNKLNVEYPQMFGIGSQLRVCCDVIERYLKK